MFKKILLNFLGFLSASSVMANETTQTNEDVKIRHAYYSEKAAQTIGTVTYQTPDGDILIATAIMDTKTTEGYAFDDVQYLGTVSEFIQSNLNQFRPFH